MTSSLLSFILVAQALLAPVQAYTTLGGELVTPDGHYVISWGHNCDAIPLGANVELWLVDGVPGQAALAPLDDMSAPATVQATGPDTVASQLCSTLLEHVDSTPCATSEAGACDIAREPAQ